MLEFKVTGKTINQAIQNGIEKLGVNKENVEIKVLTPPQNFKDAEVLICVPKVFATPELEDLFAVQNIDNQIAKTQKSVQKRRKEKNEILKKLITEVVFEGFRDEQCEEILAGFDELASNLRKSVSELKNK